MALYEESMGPDYILAGPAFSNLAQLYRMQGRYAEAEAAHHRALAIFAQEPESDHPTIARAFVRLAVFYAEQDRDEEARPLYQRALAMYERAVETDHPEAVEARKHYTALLEKRRDDRP
jgi:tetratricopeptide (TPR) repeat protein